MSDKHNAMKKYIIYIFNCLLLLSNMGCLSMAKVINNKSRKGNNNTRPKINKNAFHFWNYPRASYWF